MTISAEKATYVAVYSNRKRRTKVKDDFRLTFTGPDLLQEEIKVLGQPINKDGNAQAWVQQIKKHWKQSQEIIKKVTATS